MPLVERSLWTLSRLVALCFVLSALTLAGCSSSDGGPAGPDSGAEPPDAEWADGGADSGADSSPPPVDAAATDAIGDGDEPAPIDAELTDAADAALTDAADAALTDAADAADAQGDDDADAGPVQGTVNVLTQHNDALRSGANLAEATLTTANVNASQFGKLSCRTVDDQIYTQPLVLTNVQVPGVGTRDLVYVATMNDTVYAFDAARSQASAPVWSRSLLGAGAVPVVASDMTGACGGNYKDISGNIGVMGTPVIDPSTQTMYLVARTKEQGGSTFVQRLHALDVATGAERPNSPVEITATVPGTGEGGTTITFDPLKENQRSALLLQGGVVYVGWASHCDWGPYHGWLLGYDGQTLQRVATYNTTPDGDGAGIWMAGQGPAGDGAGSVYLVSGNGTVGVPGDPANVRNRGQSALRLTGAGASLSVATWFTPHEFASMNDADLDLGSAGLLLIPNTNLALFGGKTSKLYLVNRAAMGGVTIGRSDAPSVQVVALNAKHLHGGPVYWRGPDASVVYAWAEYGHLTTFRLDTAAAALDPVPLAESPSPAPDGMPGGALSISSNGAQEGTGILWAYLPLSGDANQAVVPGALHAFDAANVNVELWSTAQNAARDFPGMLAKFASPTIANGMVYLPTFSNALCTYGLLPGVTPLGAPTGLTAVATSKTSATLTWTLGSTAETSVSIERKQAPLGFASIGTAPAGATSFVDTTAVPFASYSYRVRALGSPAPSAYSNIASVTMNVGAPAPRMILSGNGQPIADGAAASAVTGTNFGAVALSGATELITIQNVGNAPLNLVLPVSIGGANPQAFSVVSAPSTQVAPGEATTLRLAFAPASPGPKVATVAITNDDPDQSPFNFAVSGSGIADQVGFWKLDETTGQTAADSSGEGHDGACTNVAWVGGHVGGAGSFDGSTSFIQVADDASLDPEGLSIAAWVNATDWIGGNRRIVQKGAGDSQYRLLVENGVLKLDIAGVGTITSALPATGVWVHIAGTYDGAALRLYVNGAQVATTAATAPMPATTDPLFIGSKSDTAPPGDHFQGAIDEVHIYGRALSPTEIAALAQ